MKPVADRNPHSMEGNRMSVSLALETFTPFFTAAIDRGFLKKVPLMRDPVNPRKAIVLACGHIAHNTDRLPHIWERVTDQTQLFGFNGGGIVLDPEYARTSRQAGLYHEAAVGQIMDFIDLAVNDGTIEQGERLSAYLYYDAPCKVIAHLGLTPSAFVQSSIRAKTHLKGFHPHGVTFKVGLLYYLGEPVMPSGLTYYAPRCDMRRFIEKFHGEAALAPTVA
ncbi:MAG: hypothetical protein HY567_03325 [Candidatus Kerfeldbacteria bacterium]|nr:hypothetical protein [Candidatus Kerfeldbacteria bacterium]